ncbi:MAG: HU family DNA-binding protein [Thermodesulfobacteriota bacterium]|mgnify:FL=1|nr:HU family DNA-binding protein [Thermodesulfobacteriota bacterium]MEE2975302.1 HU family DNA-binding protein [Thermodesulfobacteriota bacterium]|tara:strand:- start:3255 stop:3533 length:279 start_codon:yes stop_codon:yes gene_type:complete
MLRSEIEDEMTKAFKLEKNLSHQIVDLIISSMSDAISNNTRVEIRGFGSFYPKKYKSYKGRNPKTGESIVVPEKVLPLYRPSRDLLDKLNDK